VRFWQSALPLETSVSTAYATGDCAGVLDDQREELLAASTRWLIADRRAATSIGAPPATSTWRVSSMR
jgi:hypothetical protein